MAQEFTPREAGALAWLAGENRCPPIDMPTGSAAMREWLAGWDAEEDAAEDAAFMAEFGEPLGRGGGWIGCPDQLAEARAMGLTALD